MIPTSLSPQIQGMLERLRPWVECESPTFDAAAVNRMMDIAARDLTALGGEVERIRVSSEFGDAVYARLPHSRPDLPGILIMGHLDTVHPVGTLERLPFRIEGDRCYGPGILDMKGGNRAALEALAMLRDDGTEQPLPVSVLFTPDEEVGSPASRALIERIAARHRYVLVPEPALGAGVITGRYAIARFRLTAAGQPSHAGIAPGAGRSAIRILADHVSRIEALSDERRTFSVGVVHGGQWVNCVPSLCHGEVLSMARRQQDLDAGVADLKALAYRDDAGSLEIDLTSVRPVWEPAEGTMELYETANALAAGLGFSLPHGSSGGGSDGNFTGAMGLPTLDGVGLRGRGLHTLEEYVEIESLPERARLMAGLISALGSPST